MIHGMTIPSITLYGIPNCDTVKKARTWLTEAGAEVRFHDFKKQGVPELRLDAWIASAGWDALLNRRGTTWRKLDPATQASVSDATSAKALMLIQPSLIKRPVVEWGNQGNPAITVGFEPQSFTTALRDGQSSIKGRG